MFLKLSLSDGTDTVIDTYNAREIHSSGSPRRSVLINNYGHSHKKASHTTISVRSIEVVLTEWEGRWPGRKAKTRSTQN